MIKYEVYFVVNDNPLTYNPATGRAYDGKWCDRTGHQVASPREATPYLNRKMAQALINRLDKIGPKCPPWACGYKNTDKQKGKYRIVTATLTIEGEQ